MLHSVPTTAYISPAGTVSRTLLDLASRPHLLVAGATGSGKSVAINGIIASLLYTQSPFDCQFALIDPKKVELIKYARLPHTARYASEPADMLRTLEWASEEMDRRYSEMQRRGQTEYPGPHLYVIIDELADLMTTMKKEAFPPIQRIGQLGRACRCHLIVATQCVLAKIIPTELKCNLSTVIGLRTATKAHSRLLIDAPGCESLPDPKREGKGYALVRDGADLEKIPVYKYPQEDIDFLLHWWTSSACIAQ